MKLKLNKKEVNIVRHFAFLVNLFSHDEEKNRAEMKERIPDRKWELAENYYAYLTSTDGVKTYVVDFIASGAGHMTFHNLTSEEAIEKAVYQLQNGAFNRSDKRDEIQIQKVYPDTIFHNTYKDYLQGIQVKVEEQEAV
ncbi:hypothetical protein ACFVS2_20960 [Brevibacillus sp. NPDC058079]|uniref:hypothetical protein n=1 Tax=Brevibacillus sp. NPDC058079 TaxID=3346330 RepID=UPI0036E7B70A